MGYKSIFDIELTPPEGMQFFWMSGKSPVDPYYRHARYDDIKINDLLSLLKFVRPGNNDVLDEGFLPLDNNSLIEYRGLTLMIRPLKEEESEEEPEEEFSQENLDLLNKINAYPTEEIPDMKNSKDVIAGRIGCPSPIIDTIGADFFNLGEITNLIMPYLEAIDQVKLMHPFTCKHCEMEIVPYKAKFDGDNQCYVRNDMYFELLEKETGVKLTKEKTKAKPTVKKKPSPKKPVKKSKPVKKKTKKPVKTKAKPKPKTKQKTPKKKPVKR